jgi:hypothetical protein
MGERRMLAARATNCVKSTIYPSYSMLAVRDGER